MKIYCNLPWLKRGCEASGIPWELCQQCVVQDDGGRIAADPQHPHFPRQRPKATAASVSGGPGTELKKLLKRFGIVAKPSCSCNGRAQEMDMYGCDWCEQNMARIVGWLREEAARRKLPFADFVGRTLVKVAIARARRSIDR